MQKIKISERMKNRLIVWGTGIVLIGLGHITEHFISTLVFFTAGVFWSSVFGKDGKMHTVQQKVIDFEKNLDRIERIFTPIVEWCKEQHKDGRVQ